MIEFRPPQLSDKSWVEALLSRTDYRGCEYNFTNLYAWKDAYQYEIAPLNGFLVTRLCGSLGCSFLYPAGGGDVTGAILALRAEAEAREQPLRLVCLISDQVEELERRFPSQFIYEPDRPGFDYLYEIDRLADLGGKRLHAKRNHINRFNQDNADWTYEEINEKNLPECLLMNEQWYLRSRAQEGASEELDLSSESVALRSATAAFGPLGLEGGLIRLYGEVVAFSIGDLLGTDSYDVHFEKAYSELQGAYAVINREFVRWVRARHPQVRYLNREDDMGVEGLRKAKESYYPDLMVEKYSAVQVESERRNHP